MKFLLIIVLFCTFSFAELNIYTNEEPPQNYTENGKITGIGTDIVKEIQKRISDNSQIEVYTWTRAIAITKKNTDTILFLAGKTKDRESYFTFIGPILQKSYKLYGQSDKQYKIKNIDDAKNIQRITCVMDDVREVFMRQQGFKNLVYANDHHHALELMLMGKSDLWASSDWESKIQLKTLKKEPNTIKPFYTLYKNVNYIAFNNKTDKTIIKKWEDALKEIKADGTMDKIAQKWSKKLDLKLKYSQQSSAIGIIED